MEIAKYFILCLGLVVAQERSKYANKTADITSINNLAYKPPLTLDPKIRKALLNVLNRLEEQDNKKTASFGGDSKFAKKEKTVNEYYYTSTVSTPPTRGGDVTWEYGEAADDFDFYNVNVATSRSVVSNEIKGQKNVNKNGDVGERGGALFFQIPEKQQALIDNYHRVTASNLRSGLNAPSSSSSSSSSTPKSAPLPGTDILFANLQKAINQQQYLPERSTTSTTTTSTTPKSTTTVRPPPQIINETEDVTKSPTATTTTTSDKSVEFFRAPLLTAFTLEQDERGLPRRIIPLEVPEAELQSILRNRIHHQLEAWEGRRGARDQQKDTAVLGATAPQYRDKPADFVQREDPLFRLELESQYQQLLQERKREIELAKERLLAEQAEKARRLKFALERQQREQEYARALVSRNEIFNPEVAFQKSVEPQIRLLVPVPSSLPALPPLPPQAYNFPTWQQQQQQQQLQYFQRATPVTQQQQQFVELPRLVDRQLQSLFQQSGLNPQGQQEDLNIVSKVLALNHEPSDESRVASKRTESGAHRNNETNNLAERTTASALVAGKSSRSSGNLGFGRPDFVF